MPRSKISIRKKGGRPEASSLFCEILKKIWKGVWKRPTFSRWEEEVKEENGPVGVVRWTEEGLCRAWGWSLCRAQVPGKVFLGRDERLRPAGSRHIRLLGEGDKKEAGQFCPASGENWKKGLNRRCGNAFALCRCSGEARGLCGRRVRPDTRRRPFSRWGFRGSCGRSWPGPGRREPWPAGSGGR